MNMDKKLMVSVIMPAYNAEKYIVKAINSVLEQTYQNLELIVIDDCSTDTTYETVLNMLEKDARIRLYKNEMNLGVARTRNRGFELANGDYIALLDSDDIWMEDKIEKQINLAQKSNADIIYCSYAMVDVNENIIKIFPVKEHADFSSMLVKSVISCSTAMLKKAVTEKYHFDEQFYHEDYLLWLELLSSGYKAVGTTDVLAKYRIVEKSRSSNKIKSALNRWKIYRKYLKLPIFKAAYVWGLYIVVAMKKYYL